MGLKGRERRDAWSDWAISPGASGLSPRLLTSHRIHGGPRGPTRSYGTTTCAELARAIAIGTSVAECTHAMRERTPSSGVGFALTLIVVIVATVLVLTNIAEKFPRP